MMSTEPVHIEMDTQCQTGLKNLAVFSQVAMATTFQIMTVHPDRKYASGAATEAFDLLARLEQDLSRYVENSDIARVNHAPAGQAVHLGIHACQCLSIAQQVYHQTSGAFDVTVAPLVDYWKRSGRSLENNKPQGGWSCVGMDHLHLDCDQFTVTKEKQATQIDLGGIGKGYAIDQMTQLLEEWEVTPALIHGGCSTVKPLGVPAGVPGWPITISHPLQSGQVLQKLYLQKQSLSSSGLLKGRHIIDPRTARFVEGKIAVWASADEGALADAYSTAFMVMSLSEIQAFCRDHPNVRAIVFPEEPSKEEEDPCRSLRRFGLAGKNGIL